MPRLRPPCQHGCVANPRKFDRARAFQLYEEGLSATEIARRLSAEGGQTVTRQAVSKAIAKYESGEDADRLPPWPWRIASRHQEQRNSLYKAALAHRKRAAGRKLADREKRMAEALEEAAHKWRKVISYDQEIGFYWTNPRPDEVKRGDLFVKR